MKPTVKLSGVFVLWCSWERRCHILGMIRNDEKSMWLVGEEDGKIQIGFIVSFDKLISEYKKKNVLSLSNLCTAHLI